MRGNPGLLLKDYRIRNTLSAGGIWLEDKLGCVGDHQEEGVV